MPPADLTTRLADLNNPTDAAAVLALIDAYSRDPYGDAKPLADDVRERLIPALREHPTTLMFLALLGDKPVGVATCFVGFSTFAGRQLINVHDLAVLPEGRGKGIGRALLASIEATALDRGYCKLTLEVVERNDPARGLYESFGFRQATYAEGGGALFYSKSFGPPKPA